MSDRELIAGVAALSICESILLCLVDNSVITTAEAQGILEDAASVHINAAMLNHTPNMHQQVAELITSLTAGRSTQMWQ